MNIKLLFLCVLFTQAANGQKPVISKVTFLHKTPVIDGRLDPGLATLEKRKFNHVYNFDNPVKENIEVYYRMGYTPTHFYLYIETRADSITYRDRGFINGDGFKLLFAKPQNDSLTDEYYDIVFTPSRMENYWAGKRIWEYNRKQNSGKKLSSRTVFKESNSNGKCGFEVLLAWQDIEPYHPWFLKEMGCNLYFAKAIANDQAYGYAIVEDEGIWDEEIPKRNYAPITFEIPSSAIGDEFTSAKPGRRHLKKGETLNLDVVSRSDKNRAKIFRIVVQDSTAKTIWQKEVNYQYKSHFTRTTLPIDLNDLTPANYNLLLVCGKDTIAQYPFVIFPDLDFNSIRSDIKANRHHSETGTVNTLMYKANQLEQLLNALKDYETGTAEWVMYEKFKTEYTLFREGKDPYKGITGNHRRAFQSRYDNTYQPYSIKLPADYDPQKKYPLLVFLHGSGQDEQTVLNSPRSGGNFIELAPLGRDMYRCYSSDSSQNDIIEAMEDVKRHFSVDTQKIIVGGFSMGGYGALRTFYEHPGLYRGVAVFAGHPDLAREWLDREQPNFLDGKYLGSFSKVPVFVYHGRKDGALPVSKAEELIAVLKEKGIAVTARIIDDKAHEYPDAETNAIYFQWLNNVIMK